MCWEDRIGLLNFDLTSLVVRVLVVYPRINQITHHTPRHWQATVTYHATKDILHVKQLLGHKKIDSTLIYVNLANAIFQTEDNNFHVKTAEIPEEITQLLEVGFEYVCQNEAWYS